MVRRRWYRGWSPQLVALSIPLVSLQLVFLTDVGRASQHYGSPKSGLRTLAWLSPALTCRLQADHAQLGSLPPLASKPKPPPLPPKPSRRGKPPVPPKPPEYDETAATAAKLKLRAQQDEAERLAMEQQHYYDEMAEQSIVSYEAEQRLTAVYTEEQAAAREALVLEAADAELDEVAALAMRAEEEKDAVEADAAQGHLTARLAAEKQRAIDEEEAYFKAHGMHGYEL